MPTFKQARDFLLANSYMARLPLDTNVFELIIKATNMPFEGRG